MRLEHYIPRTLRPRVVNHRNTCSKLDFDAKRTRAHRAVPSDKNHHSNKCLYRVYSFTGVPLLAHPSQAPSILRRFISASLCLYHFAPFTNRSPGTGYANRSRPTVLAKHIVFLKNLIWGWAFFLFLQFWVWKPSCHLINVCGYSR